MIMQSSFQLVYGPEALLATSVPLPKTPQLKVRKNLLVGQIVGGRVFSARRPLLPVRCSQSCVVARSWFYLKESASESQSIWSITSQRRSAPSGPVGWPLLNGRRAARKPSLPTSTFLARYELLKLMDEPKSLAHPGPGMKPEPDAVPNLAHPQKRVATGNT
jgi:hypothetical protein